MTDEVMADEARSVVEGAEPVAGGFPEESRPADYPAGSTVVAPVRELPVRVKKVVTTDEGKLQVQLEAEALSDEQVNKVKGLLTMQQGLVLTTFDPAQGDLLGYDA